MFQPSRIALLIASLYSPCLLAQNSESKLLPEVEVRADAERSYKADTVTVAGKTAQKLRDIPNSVSVLTRAQMDDQNMVTAWDALSQMTGIQAIANDITQGQYHSRGGALELQNDGAPSTLPLSGYQQFDLALYERIEVQRGPTGLLQGSGSFSGAVNLVRKRPLDHFSSRFVAQTGSWNNNRLEADVTGPLNDNGTLRGRAVVSYIDRDYVFNRVHDQKWLAYATLDFDFTPQTKANLFFAYQDNDSTGFSGLPAYTNGKFLSVDRSFNPYPDWNRSRWNTRDIGAELKHDWSNTWSTTLRLARRDQDSFFKDSYPTDGVNPTTQIISNYARREFDYSYAHNSADLFASGPFELFGRRHAALIGANYSRFESIGHGANPSSPSSSYLNVANVLFADPPAVAEPNVIYRTGSQNLTTQSGYYGRFTLSLADSLKAVLGTRFSNFDYKSRTIDPNPTPTAWAQGGRSSGRMTPYAGLVFDLNKQVSLYASYADIFVPQTQQRVDLTVLPPRVGKQYEIGSKADFLDGQLSATLALFKIHDTNRALSDANNPGYFLTAGELESKGWELEVVGRPMRGLDLSAGYTYLATHWLNNGNATGQPVSFWYPRHMVKLWSKYRFSDDVFKGFSIGFGLNGASQSASGAPSATVAARSQNEYAVVKLQLGYEIDKNTALSLDINNLFDTTYYTRLGGTNTYNTFGDPRNAVLSLRIKY